MRSLLRAYTGVKHLVVVGDDRIVPLARMADRTVLLPESTYPAPGGDLTPAGTTVGAGAGGEQVPVGRPAGGGGHVSPAELGDSLFMPDLSVGRLVETPAEITTTIATFISQDGVLDLTALDPSSGHKVLVTGYDFLVDSARQMRATLEGGAGRVDAGRLRGAGRRGPGRQQLGRSATSRSAARPCATHLAATAGTRYGVLSS